MFRTTIAAVSMLMSTAVSGTSTIALSKDGYEAKISYGDLNLNSPADRLTLTERIHQAAGLVCFDLSSFPPPVGARARTECERVAVQKGVAQMNAISGRAG